MNEYFRKVNGNLDVKGSETITIIFFPKEDDKTRYQERHVAEAFDQLFGPGAYKRLRRSHLGRFSRNRDGLFFNNPNELYSFEVSRSDFERVVLLKSSI